MLVNSGGGELEQRGSCVLSIIADSSNITSQSDTNSVPHLLGPLQVGGAHSMTPCVRNAFFITRYRTCTFKLTQSHTHSVWPVLSSVVCVQCWWDIRWRGAPIRSKLCPENDRRLCWRGKQAHGMSCIQFYIISEFPSLSMQSVGFLTAIPRQWSQNISEVCQEVSTTGVESSRGVWFPVLVEGDLLWPPRKAWKWRIPCSGSHFQLTLFQMYLLLLLSNVIMWSGCFVLAGEQQGFDFPL